MGEGTHHNLDVIISKLVVLFVGIVILIAFDLPAVCIVTFEFVCQIGGVPVEELNKLEVEFL